jgi:hypothetical protein
VRHKVHELISDLAPAAAANVYVHFFIFIDDGRVARRICRPYYLGLFN